MLALIPQSPADRFALPAGLDRLRRVVLLPLITLLLMLGLMYLVYRSHQVEEREYSQNVTTLVAGQAGRLLSGAIYGQSRLLGRLRAEEARFGKNLDEPDYERLPKDISVFPLIYAVVRSNRAGVATVIWSTKGGLTVGSSFDDFHSPTWQRALTVARTLDSTRVVANNLRTPELLWLVLPMPAGKDSNDQRAYAVAIRVPDFVNATVEDELLTQFAVTVADKFGRARFVSPSKPAAGWSVTVPIDFIDTRWSMKFTPTQEFLSTLPQASTSYLLIAVGILTIALPAGVLWINLKRQSERENGRRRLSAIEGLNRVVADLLAAQGDAKGLLGLLADTASEVFRMPTVSILVPVGSEPQEMEIVYWKEGRAPSQLKYKLSEMTATQFALANREYTYTEDALKAPGRFETSILEKWSIRASIILPLVVREQAIGVLILCDQQPRRFTEFDKSLMRLFSNQAAIVLGHSRLYEQLRDHLQTNRVLLRELNHRVKNNLAGIQGLLVMDQPDLSSDAQAWLDRVSQRIDTMARAHDLFANQQQQLRLGDFLRTTLNSVTAIKPSAVEIQLDFGDAEAVLLEGDTAVTLAIAINELCYNALVHGAGVDGEVHVQTSLPTPGQLEICVIDVPGLRGKRGGGVASVIHSTGMGLSLVTGLITRELGGTLNFVNGPGGGTCAKVTIPLSSSVKRS